MTDFIMKYWTEQTENFFPPDLPIDLMNHSKTDLYDSLSENINSQLWQRFEKNSRASDISPENAVMGIFSKVISMWSAKQEFIFTLNQANEQLVLLKVKDCGQPLTEISGDLKAQIELINQESYALKHEDIKAISNYNNTSSYCQIMFCNYLHIPTADCKDHPDTYIKVLLCCDGADKTVKLRFNRNTFSETRAKSLFQVLINEILCYSMDAGIWKETRKIPLSLEDQALLDRMNHTGSSEKYQTLGEIMELSFYRYNNLPALISDYDHYTYAQLFLKVKNVSMILQKAGVTKGSRIAILMNKRAEMVITVLAAVYTGAVYVPIDTDNNRERLDLCLAEAECSVLVYENDVVAQFNLSDPVKCIMINADDNTFLDDYTDELPLVKTELSDLYSIIYTSGSTGRPKGVMLHHEGIVSCILHINRTFGVNCQDKTIGLANLSHDISVYDIFAAVIAGGAIVIPVREQAKNPLSWVDLVLNHKVTTWFTVPGMMELFVEAAAHRQISAFPKLQKVMLGGDVLPVNLADKIWALSPLAMIGNLGGVTETSLISNIHIVMPEDRNRVRIPYGAPITNSKQYILNQNMQLCPAGVPGIIYAEGIGVGKGYVNNPEKTSEAFVINPYTQNLAYRTGDIGCYLEEGVVDFWGRSDFQVKINGNRIELSEIEIVGLAFPGIDVAIAAVNHFDKSAINFYFKSAEVINPDLLYQYFWEQLPHYMVPKFYLQIDEVPVNKTGKIDRKKLPSIDKNKAELASRIALTTDTMIGIHQCYCEILNIHQIDIHSNFFRMGGDSFLAARLLYRLEHLFGQGISLPALFEYPTIASLSNYIDNEMTTVSMIEHNNLITDIPLTFSQQGIWFNDKNMPIYNVVASTATKEALSIDLFNQAIDHVVSENEELHSVILELNCQPYKEVRNPRYPKVTMENYLNMDSVQVREKFEKEEFERQYCLADLPLFHVRAGHGADDIIVVTVGMHHIIADAYAVVLFLEKVDYAYGKLKCQEQAITDGFMERKITLSDYAIWQKKEFERGSFQRDIDYWRKKLNGEIPVIDFEAEDRSYGEYEGGAKDIEIPDQAVEALKEICIKEGATLFTGLTSLLYIFLNYLYDLNEFAIGTGVSGRDISETASIIGNFASAQVLRTAIDTDESFINLLERVNETMKGAYLHGRLPYEKIIKEAGINRKYYDLPYKILIDYVDKELENTNLSFMPLQYSHITTPADLTLFITAAKQQVRLQFHYRKSLFHEQEIADFTLLMRDILNEVTKNPGLPIRDYSI